MEYMDDTNTEEGRHKILCCQCGTPIEPNPANMCVACLRTQVDITEGIPKQATLQFCKGCERYFQPPSEWISCSLESRELLSVCLKKLKGLSRVKLVDAGFVWTEPHSKRLKVKLTVHAEVLGGTILQQVFVVEYIIAYLMCDDCHRSEAQDYWRSLVQVRQKSENKKTFFYLEQLILKHRAHEHTLGIKPVNDGLDFFFSTDTNARKMLDFLTSMLPCRCQTSKRLISQDIHSNICNYKFTYSVELVPASKDSVVCLPSKLTHKLGGISPLCLIFRVTSAVHLMDPATAQIAEVSSSLFWRNAFDNICNPKQLVEYIVMDIEPVLYKDRKTFPGQGAISNKHLLADIWVVKATELGLTENTIHTKTHLGHILKPGDSVLGYAMGDSNINDPNFEKLDSSRIPDVILVKKYYGDRTKRPRNWKLKHLNEEDTNLNICTNDYLEFLNDLEEDPAYRQNVNIYIDKSKPQIPVDTDDIDDPNAPYITLDEMLEDLNLDDEEMQDGE